MKTKKTCWQVHRCGREVGGEHVHDLGVCPASLEPRLDGAHGGRNAGRSCWVVAGTLCGGEVQGSFAGKFGNCKNCGFYKMVQEEELGSFRMSIVLLSQLKQAHG